MMLKNGLSWFLSLPAILLFLSPAIGQPSILSFTPKLAKPGETITISGNNFNTTTGQNAVYFGSTGGLVTAASANELVVTLPEGSRFGQITVINKATGLSAVSHEPFVPVFDDGGRIIPASFDPKEEIILTGEPSGLSLNDMDGDGLTDIVVSQRSNVVTIFRNLGEGGDLTSASFAAGVSFSGAGNSGGLRVEDLDGDGKPDISSGYSSGSATFFATFRNTSTPGNLTFESVEYWQGLVYSGFLSNVADIDGDGRMDLIGQHGNGSVNVDFWIALNISAPGDITFGASVSYFGSSTLDAGSGVSVGDLDNDGKSEVIVVHNFGNRFHIIKNNSFPGTISFGTPFFINEGVNGGIQIFDFNSDGKLDIGWKKGYSNDDITILLNTNADGTLDETDFSTKVILDTNLGNYGGMSIADINGDGKPDIMTSDASNIGVFENVYTGGEFSSSAYVAAYVQPGSGNSTYPTTVLAGDLNGDNKPDLVVGITNTNPGRLNLYENKNFHAPAISLNTVSPLTGPPGSSVTITGDYFATVPSDNLVRFGSMKAVVQSATRNQLVVTVPPGAPIGPVSVTRDGLTSTYHLSFQPTFSGGVDFDDTHFAPPVSFTLTGADYDVEAGDLNNDGKPDVVAEGASFRAYSFLNTHDGGALSISSLTPDDTTSSSAQNPRLMDLDGDGFTDIISINGAYQNMSASGELKFNSLNGFSTGATHNFADFNNDGKIDFVGVASTQVAVVENRTRPGMFVNSSGPLQSFSASYYYSKSASGGGTITGDFDNDGLMDFAATDPGTDNVAIWKNNGSYRISTTQFTALAGIGVGDNPGRIYAADFDSDGKIDLMLYYSATTTSQFVTILHNQSTPGNIAFNRVDLPMGAVAATATIDDLDGDGKPEIIVASATANRFSILKNNATPGIITPSSFAAPFHTTVTAPRGIATGDLNLDGKPEVILTRVGLLLVYENLIPNNGLIIETQPQNKSACFESSATLSLSASGTTNVSYQWQKFDEQNSVFADIADDASYTGTTTSTLYINDVSSLTSGEYRNIVSGDNVNDVVSAIAELTIEPAPIPPVVDPVSTCAGSSAAIIASGGTDGQYRWYNVAEGGNPIAGEVNGIYETPVLQAETAFYAAIDNGVCESSRTMVMILVTTAPAKPEIISSGNIPNSLCVGETLTLSAPPGFSYLWSNGESDDQITVTEAGNYTVEVTDGNGCSALSEIFAVELSDCNQAPEIMTATAQTTIGGQVTIHLPDLISDPDNDLNLGSLHIVSQPASQALAQIDGDFNLLLDYQDLSFSGEDHLTIEVCDVKDNCVQQTLTIKIIGDIVIYNGISPNGDGKNDFWLIEHIEALTETQNNHVRIFNRWGDLVWEARNYDNHAVRFMGLNKNGNALPSGAYYYKLDFSGNRKTESGYLSLKK